MRKILLPLILLSFVWQEGNAQFWKLRKLEFGTGMGTTQFYGDIGGFSRGTNLIGIKDFTFRQTRYNINMNVRYRILENVSARINFTYGAYHSTDVRGSNEGRGLRQQPGSLNMPLLVNIIFSGTKEKEAS